MAKTKGYGSLTKAGTDRAGKTIWLIRLEMASFEQPAAGSSKAGEAPRRNRPHAYVHGSKTDAKKALAAWKADVDKGLKVDAAKLTLGEYADAWQQSRRELETVRPTTLDKDAAMIAGICKYLGGMVLCGLDKTTIEHAYSLMRKDGTAPISVYMRHMKLKQILQSAVDDDLILKNPCRKIEMKKPEPVDNRSSLTPAQAAKLARALDAAGDGDARIIGVRLGLATGMRIGEVLGLTWQHVDLEAGTLEVVQQQTAKYGTEPPKTKAGTRTIGIDADTAAHLEAWKAAQAEQAKEMWRMADGTVDLAGFEKSRKAGDALPVVTNDAGKYFNPADYRRWFRGFCIREGFGKWVDADGNEIRRTAWKAADGTRAGGNGCDESGKPYSRSNRKPRQKRRYAGLRFHELRHTQATLLIASGADIKTVQARLGHSKASITLDMYAHAMPENDRKAADTIAAILGAEPPDAGKVVNL